MYRPGKIMKAGSWADPDFNGALTYQTINATAVLDMTQPTPQWRSTAPMAFARAYENLTLLPDGTVLASGGMTDSDGIDLTKAVLPAEIWNPDHRDVDDGRVDVGPARVPLDGPAAAGRPRADGRRRPAPGLAGGERDQRADLLAALPVQGRCGRRSRAPPQQIAYSSTFTVTHARRRVDPVGRADPHAVGHARVRPEPALTSR